MKNISSNKRTASEKSEKRPVDNWVDRYEEFHRQPANRVINYICIPLVVFSILGFVWSIPFPHIGFLSSNNDCFNWASFLIAFTIYYYFKLSPTISFLMLIVLFGLTFGVIEMIAWQKSGGLILPQICIVVFFVANIFQLVGYRIEGNKPTRVEDTKFIVIGPVWLLAVILKKVKIKY